MAAFPAPTTRPAQVEMGLDTFGDVTVDGEGRRRSDAQVLRDLVDQAVVADQAGVDAFGVGEHHRNDFVVSAPEVVLAAIAARTERIKLGSAVTVLSSDDPVRVYERFATVDGISGGRAEITLGRGSFVESFPLFGYDLDDYEELFTEKLDLFAQLRHEGVVNWSGNLRAPLRGLEVFPKTERGIDTWVGVGGSPASVLRAAHHQLPLMLAIIGGDAGRFQPLVRRYRQALAESGGPDLPVGVHSPGHIADTDEQAIEELYPYFKANRDRIGAERGWPPLTDDEYHRAAGPYGSLYVGSPDTVAAKIAATVGRLGLDRFDLKYASGAMPHELLVRSIELYGTKVIDQVRDRLTSSTPASGL